jgi:hypothetical protein
MTTSQVTIDPSSTRGRLILTGLLLLVFGTILFIAYKILWQFKDATVKGYINDEASKYADPAMATKILTQGCHHILTSNSLTKQVLDSAAQSGVPREQELVHAALMQAIAYGYLGKQP